MDLEAKVLQHPVSFNIEELDLHGLTLEELNKNRWCMLAGYGRKEILVRTLDLENRIFPEYVLDKAQHSELSELCDELLTREEVQTIIDVLAHKGCFVRMHHASAYNSKEQEAKVAKLQEILTNLKPGERIRLTFKTKVPASVAKQVRETHGIAFILSANDQDKLRRLEVNAPQHQPVVITPELRDYVMSWKQFIHLVDDTFDKVELVN